MEGKWRQEDTVTQFVKRTPSELARNAARKGGLKLRHPEFGHGTRGLRVVVSLLLMLAALPTVVAAQAESEEAVPEYRVLRFDEDWAVLRALPAPEPLDRIKYLPLTADGGVYVSGGGQLRFRAEAVRNFLLSEDPGDDDSFGLARAFLHADLHAGQHVRVFVEGKHAMAYGRSLPGGRRPLDHDEWDLQNLFVDVSCCASAGADVTMRVGRQEVLLGSQRLVSPLDWSNTRRTFDGVRFLAQLGGMHADAFWTYPVTIRTTGVNRRERTDAFSGLMVRPEATASGVAWEAYVLRLQQGESIRPWRGAADHDRVTLGARLSGPAPFATKFEVEGGWQGGEAAGESISAWFVASELGRSLETRFSPAIAVAFDYASGDRTPGEGTLGTFNQLFPLGHAYAGFMDLLGRQNLIEARVVAAANPVDRVQTRAALHRFLRARSEDAVYNVGGGVLRPAGADGDRAIGTELNLTAAYHLLRHVSLELGYGHFWAGASMTAEAATARGSDWLYLSTAFTF